MTIQERLRRSNLIMLIAFSRMYLYVHFPSDVLASVLLGLGIGLVALWMQNFRGACIGGRQRL